MNVPARLLATLVLALATFGCSTTTLKVGRNFDLDTVAAKLQRGTTTESEVRAWLGSPTGTGVSVEQNGETLTQWTYFYGEGDLSGLTDTAIKTLQIKFDRQGIAQSFNWSNTRR